MSDREIMNSKPNWSKAMKKLFYFSAPWCGPCKTFGPIMDQEVKRFSGVKPMQQVIDFYNG